MKDNINELFVAVVSGFGIYLAFVHPMAGAAVVACGLSYGIARIATEQRDARKAQQVIDGLQGVVNANAKRLEQLIVDFEKLSGEFEFSKTGKRMMGGF